MSGPLRSGYSANENAGDATQISGMKNPTHARTRRPVSSGVLWLLATLTLRLRRPCGARMAIITAVPASTTALAIHGFMAKHRSLFRDPPNVGVQPRRVLRADGCNALFGGLSDEDPRSFSRTDCRTSMAALTPADRAIRLSACTSLEISATASGGSSTR